jgi:hypothetical protein
MKPSVKKQMMAITSAPTANRAQLMFMSITSAGRGEASAQHYLSERRF